jgi:hypothetical protein
MYTRDTIVRSVSNNSITVNYQGITIFDGESDLYACHFALETPYDYIHFNDSKYCIIIH